MVKKWNLFLVLVLLAVTVSLSSSVALAQDPGINVTVDSAGISWQAEGNNDGVHLVINGPDAFQVDEVYGGNSGSFNAGGGPDGAYEYELTTMPHIDDSVREAMNSVPEEDRAAVQQQLRDAGKITDAVSGSGAFYMIGGAVSSFDGDEPSAEKDFLINDDLIVDGSACVGFDCVNGESFGFDTIRLKENNLRIKFDDTSVAANFPKNDWQITVNDSANGGQAKFSVDDITGGRTPFTIEANARSHSLYVDDGGRIGIRTSTPSTEIHMIDGDTPTVRLQQDGSSGFAPQTWDVAGNETNFFIRDVSNGSTLPFRIRPGAPSSSIFIDTDGDVGLGTASPDALLSLTNGGSGADGLPRIRFTNNDASIEWNMDVADNDVFRISEEGSGGTEFEIDGNGNVTIQSGAGGAANLTVTGDIVSGGSGNCAPPNPACDGTFAPDYDVPTIEEHAAFMWENSYLWGVGSTKEGTPFNVTKKTAGILHELEVAHIYIEQLNEALKIKTAEVESLNERLARLERLLEVQDQ